MLPEVSMRPIVSSPLLGSGESMERGQQAERLAVIEHPSLPQKPVRPKRSKWFAAAFALALLIGAGSAGAAEMLDHRIRGSRDLTTIIDRDLIVALPYLATPGQECRKRRSFILVCTALVAAFACAIGAAVFLGISVDFSWFDHSGIDVFDLSSEVTAFTTRRLTRRPARCHGKN